MEELVVAAVNFNARFGEIEANLESIERWAERLAGEGADIICFPEMSVCGYDRTDAVQELAQPIPGYATDLLVEAAARHDVTLLAGLPESCDGGRPFISHVVATPGGLAGVYRKAHVGPSEQEAFRRGDEIGVFEHVRCRFGIQLCYDAHYPEVSTLQALSGGEVLFVAFASPRDDPAAKRERMLRYLPARAYDNGCYVVSCNLVGEGNAGQRFAGVAFVINPKGEVLAEAVGWGEGAVLARIDGREIERLRRTRMGYFPAHRRPELYGGLVRRR